VTVGWVLSLKAIKERERERSNINESTVYNSFDF
jgi:hypothetical protein